MRLSEDQVRIIKEETVHYFGESARVLLFGSRTDDTKRGGDIDLYIEADYSEEELFMKKIDLLTGLHFKLGERKIDIITCNRAHHHGTNRPVVREALATGVEL